MAMHFTRATLQGLSRTSAPDYNAPYTVLGLVRITTLLSAPGLAAQISTLEEGNNNFEVLQVTRPSADSLIGIVVNVAAGGNITVTGTTVLAAATWYFVAMVRRSATVCEAYLGTSPSGVALELTHTTNITARTAAVRLHLAEWFGNDLDGDMRAWRAYTSALSLDQLKAEALRFTPFLTGAWGSWPLANATDLADTSGNARDFTAVNGPATLSTEPPTPPWNGPFTLFARLGQ